MNGMWRTARTLVVFGGLVVTALVRAYSSRDAGIPVNATKSELMMRIREDIAEADPDRVRALGAAIFDLGDYKTFGVSDRDALQTLTAHVFDALGFVIREPL